MVGRSLQITEPGRFSIIDRPIAEPAGSDVLVEVEASTTCPQWDMHLWRGEPMFPGHPVSYPITPGQPGHEMVGRVVAVGAEVVSLKPGQRVASWRDAGDREGCYATHVLCDQQILVAVSEEGDASRWAPLELATCVASIFVDLQTHHFLPCRCLGVAGLGPAGLIAIQMARAAGVERIIGFEPNPKRRKQAERLGCDRTFDPNDTSALPDRHHLDAMDITIECVGNPAAFELLAGHTRDVVALFGVQREAYHYTPDYYTGPPLRLWGYPPTSPKASEYAHDLVESGALNLDTLSSHHLPLRDYGRAVKLLMNHEAIKVCLHCDDGSV